MAQENLVSKENLSIISSSHFIVYIKIANLLPYSPYCNILLYPAYSFIVGAFTSFLHFSIQYTILVRQSVLNIFSVLLLPFLPNL